MNKFFVVLMAVMLIGGIGMIAPEPCPAADLELHGGAMQSTVMEGAGGHFVNLGATLSHTTSKDITFYGHAMGDFSNETVKNLEADGTHVEVGLIVPMGETSNIKIYAFDKEPHTSLDEERIGVMYNLKVPLF